MNAIAAKQATAGSGTAVTRCRPRCRTAPTKWLDRQSQRRRRSFASPFASDASPANAPLPGEEVGAIDDLIAVEVAILPPASATIPLSVSVIAPSAAGSGRFSSEKLSVYVAEKDPTEPY